MLDTLTDDILNHILKNQWYGRIACGANNEIFMAPITYLYDGDHIYGHTREGTKIRLMRQNPNVCFEVDEMVSPTHWRSVVVQGTYEELAGEDRLWALQLLGPRQPPDLSEELSTAASIAIEHLPTVVYRIHILSKSGRILQRK